MFGTGMIMKNLGKMNWGVRSTVAIFFASCALVACGGGGDTSSAAPQSQATASLTPLVPSAPTVSVNLAANSIAYSGNTTVSWTSVNSTSCTSSGGGAGTSGSFNTGPLTTETNYTVTCVGPGGSDSQSKKVSVAAPVVVNCATTGATGAINLSSLPSRLTGVAPLSVYFDTAGTTATSTDRPFHELEYKWSFGDASGSPVSGTTWKYGANPNANSRNATTGPAAGHVFEVPGTYTVTLTATDGSNTVSNNCTQIVVQDPETVFTGTKTVCFSNTGNYTGCPTGADHLQTSNFATAINSKVGVGKRLLFRRGDIFTSNAGAVISANGPGIIGAYGVSTDPKPIVRRFSNQEVTLSAGNFYTQGIGDWRVMDLDMDGQNIQEGSNYAVVSGSLFNNLLMLRLDIHGTWGGVGANHWILNPGQPIYDGWAVVDSKMTGIKGCTYLNHYNCDWRIYIAGQRLFIQGNSLDNEDDGGSHVIRSEFMKKGIINNNYIARAGIIQNTIKIHSWKWDVSSGGNSTLHTFSEQIVISDNKIVGGINPWTVALEAQNGASDERLRDVIFERNWLTAGTATQIGVNSSATNATFRNNIITIGSPADHHVGLLIGLDGIGAVPDHVDVYNNTIHSTLAGDFNGVMVGNASNVTIKNNLGYAPLSTVPNPTGVTMVYLNGNGASGLVASNNSTDFQIKNTAPAWLSATPTTPADYRTTGGSYAIGTGIGVPVFTDFFLQSRSSNVLGAALQ